MPGDGDRGLSLLGGSGVGVAQGAAAGAWLLVRGLQRGDAVLVAWITAA
jgi:hypothetical protein